MNIISNFKSYQLRIQNLLSEINTDKLEEFCSFISQAKNRNSNIFICGNGGSASTSSHFANDMRTQLGIKSISLTDISSVTCIGNDYGYNKVFSNQLKVLAKENDIIIGISASGNSPNIYEALEYGNSINMISLSLLGFNGGICYNTSKCSVLIQTPEGLYREVEDCHMILCHFIIDELTVIE